MFNLTLETSQPDPFRLLESVMFRLHRDLDGPRDSGKDGWDLSCKALLWFMFSSDFLSFPEESRTPEFLQYLCRKIVNTSHKFGLDEDLICLGLFALLNYLEESK